MPVGVPQQRFGPKLLQNVMRRPRRGMVHPFRLGRGPPGPLLRFVVDHAGVAMRAGCRAQHCKHRHRERRRRRPILRPRCSKHPHMATEEATAAGGEDGDDDEAISPWSRQSILAPSACHNAGTLRTTGAQALRRRRPFLLTLAQLRACAYTVSYTHLTLPTNREV